MAFKIKINLKDALIKIISTGAGALALNQGASAEAAAAVENITENIFDAVSIEKKPLTPVQLQDETFNRILTEALKNAAFVIPEDEEKVINELAGLKFNEKKISDNGLDAIRTAIIKILKNHSTYTENISAETLDSFISEVSKKMETSINNNTVLLLKDTHDVTKESAAAIEDIADTVEDISNRLDEIGDAVTGGDLKFHLVNSLPSRLPKDKFFGRSKKLDELADALQSSDIVFIYGVGGIGKSELASQYASSLNGMTIIHMNYRESLNIHKPQDKTPSQDNADCYLEGSGLCDLIMNMDITNYPVFSPRPGANLSEEQQLYYKNKFSILRSLCNKNTLLIIDNFNVLNDNGLKAIESLGCKAIFTTKSDYGRYYSQVRLDNIEEEDALKLFYEHCPKKQYDDENDIRQILRIVGCHTTAIILLASQKESSHAKASELLAALKNGIKNAGETNISFRKDGIIHEDKNAFGCLCAVFDIAGLDDKEKAMLANLSLLPPEGLSYRTFCELCGLNTDDKNKLNRLIKLSWVNQDNSADNVALIPVIADVVRITADAGFETCGEFLKNLLAWYDKLPLGEKPQYIAMLEAVSECMLQFSTDHMSETAARNAGYLYNEFGAIFYNHTHYKNAEPQYRNSISVLRQLTETNLESFGSNLAASLNNLALLLQNMSPEHYSKAESLYREAISIKRELVKLNPNAFSNSLAASLNNLALLLKNISPEYYSEAESLYREAISIMRQLVKLNPDAFSNDLATSLNNLALLLQNMSPAYYSETEILFREAISIGRVLVKLNPDAFGNDLATSLNNLAGLLEDISPEHYSEAESLYREAISIKKELVKLNPNAFSNDLAISLNNLAGLFKNMSPEHYSEAEKLYREAISIKREIVKLNPDAFSNDLAASLNNLALLLQNMSPAYYSEAETLFREAISIGRVLVKLNPDAFGNNLVASLNNLAGLLEDMSPAYYSEAECFYREAIEICRRLAALNHDAFDSKLAAVIYNLAYLLQKTERTDEAAELFTEYKELTKN